MTLVWVTGNSGVGKSTVRGLFDLMVCLLIDDGTLRQRLRTRTNNSFGQHPEELAAALDHNSRAESVYRLLGAAIVDGTQPPARVTDTILAAVESAGLQRSAPGSSRSLP